MLHGVPMLLLSHRTILYDNDRNSNDDNDRNSNDDDDDDYDDYDTHFLFYLDSMVMEVLTIVKNRIDFLSYIDNDNDDDDNDNDDNSNDVDDTYNNPPHHLI